MFQSLINKTIQRSSDIFNTELILSSSLHGVILAEAYGIPAVLIRNENEPLFKYKDYYMGTGRDKVVFAKSIKEGLRQIQ